MPRKFIKKYLPDSETLHKRGCMSLLGSRMHEPGLWHLNRRSVSGGVAIGLFMCWIPFPFQMVIAAALAMLFRVNLPIAAALVWTTNPVTIPPLFYAAYKLGATILGRTPLPFEMDWSIEWMKQMLSVIWAPMVVGCLLFAIVTSLLGYLSVRLLWRMSLVRRWQARRLARQNRGNA